MEDIEDLCSTFQEAATAVRNCYHLDKDSLLKLYGLYKQANLGPCNVPKPWMFSFTAKEKWEAWNCLGSMSKAEAMSRYIDLVKDVMTNYKDEETESRKASNLGFRVSCMARTDQELTDGDKNIFDWLKEGNMDQVSNMLKATPSLVKQQDEDGMLLIHWAADRGDACMIRMLLDFGSNLNATDELGQTPLHYSSACGHQDCIQLLIQAGADRSIKDKDGNLAQDLIES